MYSLSNHYIDTKTILLFTFDLNVGSSTSSRHNGYIYLGIERLKAWPQSVCQGLRDSSR